MRRTGWAKVFAHADRRLLYILDQSPARDGHHLGRGCHGGKELYSSIEDERGLAIVGRPVVCFFERCEIRHHTLIILSDAGSAVRPKDAPTQLPLDCLAANDTDCISKSMEENIVCSAAHV